MSDFAYLSQVLTMCGVPLTIPRKLCFCERLRETYSRRDIGAEQVGLCAWMSTEVVISGQERPISFQYKFQLA